eukprot:935171-Alexandrium_andersonii.AAC.1
MASPSLLARTAGVRLPRSAAVRFLLLVPAHPAHEPSLEFAQSELGPEEGGRSWPWQWPWLLASPPVGRSVGGWVPRAKP